MEAAGVLLVAAAMVVMTAIPAASNDVEDMVYHHGHHRGHHHFPRHSPPSPPTPSPPPVVPTPPPPAPTPPEPCGCCDLCRIVPDPYLPAPGEGTSSAVPFPLPPSLPLPSSPSPPAPINCATGLAPFSPCFSFLTGRSGRAPTPQSACCNGLASFVSAARGDGGQRIHCLCPLLHGEANRPRVDPYRMMLLPVGCGINFPPDTTTICFGESTPTMANLTFAAGVLHH